MKFVSDPQGLKAAEAEISKAPRLAVDTEADSLHRYTEKLCLLQISTPYEDYVFDPLVAIDLTALIKTLEKKPLIFHGADFDIRILRRFYGFRPLRIFDTMVAAQLLGYSGQGLAALVEKHFGVHLPKANQKADWSRRPLTESMIQYAANDTHYLISIAETLEKELRELGRMEWFEESCEYVLAASQTDRETDPESRWRIKGWRDLKGRGLVLLKEFWKWREEEAKRKDRPSFKVFNNEALVDVAKWKLEHAAESLTEMQKAPGQLDARKARELDEVASKAMNLPLDSIGPEPASKGGPRRMTDEEKEKLQALKDARKAIAENLKCDPGILAPNAALEAIVIGHPADEQALAALKCLKNWQVKLVAPSFINALNAPPAA